MAYSTTVYQPLTWPLLKLRYPLSHTYLLGTDWVSKLPLALHLGPQKLFYFFDAQQLFVLITGHPPDLTPGYFTYTLKFANPLTERVDWEGDQNELFATRAEAELAGFHAAFAKFERYLRQRQSTEKKPPA